MIQGLADSPDSSKSHLMFTKKVSLKILNCAHRLSGDCAYSGIDISFVLSFSGMWLTLFFQSEGKVKADRVINYSSM